MVTGNIMEGDTLVVVEVVENSETELVTLSVVRLGPSSPEKKICKLHNFQ